MPDEAQYWTWSRRLSYGYYSKPLAIAWQIAAGCALFGDTELGVRIGNTLLSFFLSVAIFRLGLFCRIPVRDACLCALAFAFCPLGIISGFLATVDCGFLLFWTCATVAFIKQLDDPDRPLSFVTCGLLIGLGAFWKWTIYFLWVPVIVFSLVMNRCLFRKVLIGILLSLCGALPALVWNARHGWASTLHVLGSVTGMQAHAANTLSFLGAQFALVSPVIFLLLLWTTFMFVKRLPRERSSVQFCWWTWVGFFALVIAQSFLKKVQGNWMLFVYPTAFVLLGAAIVYAEYFMRRLILFGIAVSIVLLALVFSIPYISNFPWKANPWRQGLGLQGCAQELLQRGYTPERDFLFSSRYQDVSQISFYGPGKKLAYFLNIHHLRKNQFSYWPSMRDRCVGKTGFFVAFLEGTDVVERIPHAQGRFIKELEPYFAHVTPLTPFSLYSVGGKVVRAAIVLRCEQYNGRMPKEEIKY